jgi:hypothetical protein
MTALMAPTITQNRYKNQGTSAMSENTTGTDGEDRVPFMQRILDNPFILLFIGIVFPAVFYIIWGIMEIVNIPIAP